jgi:hypothetical protein
VENKERERYNIERERARENERGVIFRVTGSVEGFKLLVKADCFCSYLDNTQVNGSINGLAKMTGLFLLYACCMTCAFVCSVLVLLYYIHCNHNLLQSTCTVTIRRIISFLS